MNELLNTINPVLEAACKQVGLGVVGRYTKMNPYNGSAVGDPITYVAPFVPCFNEAELNQKYLLTEQLLRNAGFRIPVGRYFHGGVREEMHYYYDQDSGNIHSIFRRRAEDLTYSSLLVEGARRASIEIKILPSVTIARFMHAFSDLQDSGLSPGGSIPRIKNYIPARLITDHLNGNDTLNGYQFRIGSDIHKHKSSGLWAPVSEDDQDYFGLTALTTDSCEMRLDRHGDLVARITDKALRNSAVFNSHKYAGGQITVLPTSDRPWYFHDYLRISRVRSELHLLIAVQEYNNIEAQVADSVVKLYELGVRQIIRGGMRYVLDAQAKQGNKLLTSPDHWSDKGGSYGYGGDQYKLRSDELNLGLNVRGFTYS